MICFNTTQIFQNFQSVDKSPNNISYWIPWYEIWLLNCLRQRALLPVGSLLINPSWPRWKPWAWVTVQVSMCTARTHPVESSPTVRWYTIRILESEAGARYRIHSNMEHRYLNHHLYHKPNTHLFDSIKMSSDQA